MTTEYDDSERPKSADDSSRDEQVNQVPEDWPSESVTDKTPSEKISKSPETPAEYFEAIMAEVAEVYVGQEEFVRLTLTALLADGHVLIESVPGLGKTLLVQILGKILGCQFQRIQFTADLMPSDITGQPIYNAKTSEFVFRPGPVFTQILLADEINRSPAKTHAALLEIMQEKHVTVDGTTRHIAPPFLVLATQNPVESEGTYNLPEAQLDRFLFKLVIDYPTPEEEDEILQLHCEPESVSQQITNDVHTLTDPETIIRLQSYCHNIRVDKRIISYINQIVRLTRNWPAFYMGASPRAGIALLNGSRVLAAFAGRDYVVPDDVAELVIPALRHRVILSPEAEVEGVSVDQSLLSLQQSIEVPRL
ncbi:MoxR family ATPase [uncultured Rubinisphaera sp.]|uniref:AAA family ATPase n=1 Tax=uncultured Rubinisphaera sp. TaxID=1678686 RepID=UPI0030D95F28